MLGTKPHPAKTGEYLPTDKLNSLQKNKQSPTQLYSDTVNDKRQLTRQADVALVTVSPRRPHNTVVLFFPALHTAFHCDKHPSVSHRLVPV
ncbi:hypothetical protein C0Q70_03749 [Pomacea canaliculata]|uniref:Uncharacterized protein n=1 Tax=Pomacea canaliculata TaxID=400727 RepID=A0A2T7PTM0_POMCA|nr:hypothetical protein C0Q70_03749 [Pomacea canaliculata]